MTDETQTYRGCIFNLDGVLVDTAKYHYEAWRQLANSLDFDISREQNEQLKGLGRMASLETILSWGGIYLSEAEKMHWADVKNNWYIGLISNMKPGEVLPGVLYFLRQVREKGMKIALSSSSQNARAVLKSTGLEPYFDVIADGNTIKRQKPDPQCFLLPAEAMGLPPAECLVFEDAPSGITAALLGGFTAIGVGRKENLKQASVVIAGFENLRIDSLLAQHSERVFI
ncbi:MAG: beta-phosphoglucomutase [Lewinellaceae bacterium]|nr:beta-phosphoglucomutase [Lewinellaceae bacterium]